MLPISPSLGSSQLHIDSNNNDSEEESSAAAPPALSYIEQMAGTDQNFILTNFLSSQWKKRSWRIVPALPFFYVGGMIGYALALPVRILIVATTLLRMIGYFFGTLLTCQFNSAEMRSQGLVFLGATGELFSSLLGIICPTAAYQIDEWIQSNDDIHAWYDTTKLSRWSHDTRDPVVAPVGNGGGPGPVEAPKVPISKKDSIVEKHKYSVLREHLKTHFKMIPDVIDPKELVNPVDEGDSGMMTLVAVLCLLQDFTKGIVVESLVQNATFKKNWDAIIEQMAQIKKVITITREISDQEFLFDLIKCEIILKDEDSENIKFKEILEEKLVPLEKISLSIEGKEISLKIAIEEMSLAARKALYATIITDNKLFTEVIRAAYPLI